MSASFYSYCFWRRLCVHVLPAPRPALFSGFWLASRSFSLSHPLPRYYLFQYCNDEDSLGHAGVVAWGVLPDVADRIAILRVL